MKTAPGKPLSNLQKATISQAASTAFHIQDRAGMVEIRGSDTQRLNDWRHEQQLEVTGHASLRECGNNHYRSLMAHFLILAGKDATAYQHLTTTGRYRDHSPAADTHEARESARHLISMELTQHGRRCLTGEPEYSAAIAAHVHAKGGCIPAAYITAIAKAQLAGRALDSLTAAELTRLLYTTRNRIAAREGRGVVAKRNKSQRATGKTQA